MNVDALSTDPPADARDEADSVEDHPVQARFHESFRRRRHWLGEVMLSKSKATLHRGIARWVRFRRKRL